MLLVWLIGGIAAVTAAYLAPGLGADLWPNLYSAEAAGAVYIVLLIVVHLRKPVPARYLVMALILFPGAVLVTFDGWQQLRADGAWRKATLHRIAESIDNGCMIAAANPPLIKVLKAHYEQPGWQTAAIGATFRRCIPGAVPGSNIGPILRHFEDSTFSPSVDFARSYISSLTDSEVILVTVANLSGGTNPDFRNFDGRSGKAQQTYHLTAKGVTYESQN